MEIMHLII